MLLIYSLSAMCCSFSPSYALMHVIKVLCHVWIITSIREYMYIAHTALAYVDDFDSYYACMYNFICTGTAFTVGAFQLTTKLGF